MSITAYVAFGSNLGDRLATLVTARRLLTDDPRISLIASSPLYETEPVGGPPGQPPFLNAVIELKTCLPARTLLQRCHQVEAALGRERLEAWGPRTIDLDLLFCGKEVCSGPTLTLPHPRLHLRPFVLVPLSDLARDLVHPVLGLSVGQLLAALDISGVRRYQGEEW